MNFLPHTALFALALVNAEPASADLAPAPSAFGSRTDSPASAKLGVQPLLAPPRALPPAMESDNKKATFPALAPSASAGKGAFNVKANKSRPNLFDMDDRAIIIVSGRQTTAGALKKSILAEIENKAGPPRIVHGGARKPVLMDAHPEHLDASATQRVNPAIAGQAQLRVERATAAGSGAPSLSTRSQSVMPIPPLIPAVPPLWAKGTFAERANHAKTDAINEFTCADKGPPAIAEIQGKMKPGQAVVLQGRCFGNQAGRVTVVSSYFPGGKLELTPAAWDMNEVKVALPGNLTGMPDHTVYVSVTTAGGKASSTKGGAFIALREHIVVPSRLWGLDKGVYAEKTIDIQRTTSGFLGTTLLIAWDPAEVARSQFVLNVNQSCALDTMDVKVYLGEVRSASGWENGPPYQGVVSVAWRPRCVDTKTVETGLFVDDIEQRNVCAISFALNATANCPVGVSPDPVSLKDQGAPARLR